MGKFCFVFALSIVFTSSVACFAQPSREPGAPDFFCATQDNNGASYDEGVSYYEALRSNVWNFDDLPDTGSTFKKLRIGVFFLNGDDKQRALVREVALEWTKDDAAKGVEWVFDNPNMKQIRIQFNGFGMSSSAIGTDALQYQDEKLATMRLSLVGGDTNKEEDRRRILHEFGHALGLMHEHQHPDTGYIFRTSQIFQDVVSRGWCNDDRGYIGDIQCLLKIESQITLPFNKSYKCPGSSEFDDSSVMAYPIQQSWIYANKGPAIKSARTISVLDKKCVGSLYPSFEGLPTCRGVAWSDAYLTGLPTEVIVLEDGVAVDDAQTPVCKFEAKQKFWVRSGKVRWLISKVDGESKYIFLYYRVLPVCNPVKEWVEVDKASKPVEVLGGGYAVTSGMPICKFEEKQKFWVLPYERGRYWFKSKVKEYENYVYLSAPSIKPRPLGQNGKESFSRDERVGFPSRP